MQGYLWWLCGVAVMSLTLLISAGMGAYQVTVHNYHCNVQLISDFQDLLYQSLNLAKTEVPWQVHMPYPGALVSSGACTEPVYKWRLVHCL